MGILEKRTVAYVVTLPHLGGAQSHLLALMEHIGGRGYAPVLITSGAGWLTERAAACGIRVHLVPDMVREIAPLHDLRAAAAIRRILKADAPALVHCHSSKAGILGRAAARTLSIPAVFTAHGWAFTEGVAPKKRALYRRIEDVAGSLAKRIICVSEYDRALGARMLPRHAQKMVTIHNAIADDAPVRDWSAPASEKIRLVCIARFSPQKKNMQAIRWIGRLRETGIAASLAFIGDGEGLAAARAEAVRLGLEQEITFLGARQDAKELLPHYDAFLLLSRWEGFPISILEAMRAALPVIASDVGGVKEAVADGVTGYLVRGEEENLMEIMQRIAADRGALARAGKAGRARYKESFGIEGMIDKVADLYDAL